MKKLLSALLALVLLFSLAPMALGSEEPVGEPESVGEAEAAPAEEIAEPAPAEEIAEPATDGFQVIDASISGGRLYWDECPGAAYYALDYRLEDGSNGRVVTEEYDYRLPYSSMPYDIQSYFEGRWAASQEISISVTAYEKRASGVSEMVGRSMNLTFSFDNRTTEPVTVYAWWEGTTIRWEKPDMTRFGINKEKEVIVRLSLYEDDREIFNSGSLSDRHLDKLGTSLDVSQYIEKPERSYRFTLWFEEKYRFTEKYESDSVTGQALLDGLDSHVVSLARIDLTLPEAGETVQADGYVTGENCIVHSQRWCSEQNIDAPLSGPFKANKTYYWFAILEPDDGYVFPGDKAGYLAADEFDVTVNGESVLSAYRDYPTRHIGVWYAYTVPAIAYGGDVELTGLTVPAAGEPILADAVPSDENLTITEQKWRVLNGSALVVAEGTFEAGKKYYYSCTVTPPEEAEFAIRDGSRYSGAITLNGEELYPLSMAELLDANARIKNGETPDLTGYSCSGGSVTLYYSAAVPGEGGETEKNTYELDLSGAVVSGSEISGTGQIVKTAGTQPEAKKYVYIVVNYERPNGTTWAVAGSYAADTDGEFDFPTITGVTDIISNVLVVGVDSKTGAAWAGHNITKPKKLP